MTRKTDIEQWEDIGRKTKHLKRELLELEKMMSDVPETVYADDLDAIDSAFTDLRSDLEGQMFQEHSELDDDALSVFYGSLTRSSTRPAKRVPQVARSD